MAFRYFCARFAGMRSVARWLLGYDRLWVHLIFKMRSMRKKMLSMQKFVVFCTAFAFLLLLSVFSKPVSIIPSRLPTSPMSTMQMCGSRWKRAQQDYASYHKRGTDVLWSDANNSYGVALYACVDSPNAHDDCGGIGDRIVGMVSTYLFAVATNRLFYVDWLAATVIFSPVTFNWVLNEGAFPPNMVTHVDRRNCGFYWGRGPCFVSPSFYDDFRIISFRINRGVVHDIFLNPEYSEWRELLEPMGLTAETAFACAFHSLFTPTQQVKHLVKPSTQVVASRSTVPFGLHFRFGESGLFESGGTFFDPSFDFRKESMIARVDKSIVSLRTLHFMTAHKVGCRLFPSFQAVWVVLSDSLEFRHAVMAFNATLSQRGGYVSWRRRSCDHVKIVIPDIKPSHISLFEYSSHNISLKRSMNDQLIDNAAEWWLLSQCHVFVLDGFSGFSRAAYAVSFGIGVHPHGRIYRSILELGHIYSGI